MTISTNATSAYHKSFTEKRLEDENVKLKVVIDKLSQNLRDCQLQVHRLEKERCEKYDLQYEDPSDLIARTMGLSDPEALEL